MSKIRVHELARQLGRQNKEVIEALKAQGIDVKSHMSNIDEASAAHIKEKFNRMRKEQKRELDTPKTEEKVVTAAENGEAPKKKKNIIRVYHAQNASDGGKTTNNKKKPAGERKGTARPQGNADTRSEQSRRPAGEGRSAEGAPRRENRGGERRPGADRQGQNRAPRTGEGRDGQNRTPRSADGAGRGPRNYQGSPRPQGDGQGRPQRQNDGTGRPVRSGDNQGRGQRPADGQGRPSRFGQGRPQGNGQGRPDGRNDGRGESRDGRFGGGQNRGGQRQNSRKNDSDMAFAPELTKTSKDSKRERDRENKNKKKDFDKNQGGGRRPNQSGFKQGSRIPKALQKPTPAPKQEEKKPEVKEITLPEKMTIRELAEAMKMQPSAIVKKLFMQGVMVTVNHEIDFEKAQEIALEYDIIAEPEEKIDVIEELLKEEEENEEDMTSRPPVVCVMGHVDHGKTSLLDAIRKTNVTSTESGGITQHIGASEVRINGQKIVFLDTPGHEAFTAMRARGAHVTDIAVLVVAADDSVKPQTIESISHAKAAGVPIIVAINKVDKPAANPDRVKQDLTEHGILVEDWGGDTICVPVSAKTGDGIVNLLEMILLQAEMMELKANPNRLAMGSVIEARLDKTKGPVATLLVTNGTLHSGQSLVAGTCSGRIRLMTDFKGKTIKKAGPATAVEILGLTEVPQAGDEFNAVKEDKIAREIAEHRKEKLREEVLARNASTTLEQLFSQIQEGEVKELNLIIKGDVQGSVGALVASLEKLNNENVKVNIIHTGVGTVTESDVMLAGTSGSIIIGFNVRPSTAVQTMADRENIQIRTYRVIYDVIDDVENAMKGMLDPEFKEEILGKVEIRNTFKVPGVGIVGGAYVIEGKVVRNADVRLVRDGIVYHEGKISSLKRFKDDAKEVNQGYECGIGLENYNDIKEGDIIECFHMVEIERK